MSEAIDRETCMDCSKIDCFRLFEKSKDSIDAGKELYVYSILTDKINKNLDLRANVCTNGHFLTASCFLTVPIFRDKRESLLCDVLIQVTRDFKASMFLAFSGHYRQALQVLRCAFENIISGVYFQSDLINLTKKKANVEDVSRLKGRFNEWKKNGRVNIRNSIEVLRRIDFLTVDEEREWKQLYNFLSRFIHTPEEFVTHVEHGGDIKLKGDFVCPASTYFNEKQLIEWSDTFQTVFTILLKTIVEFHPEAFETESGKLAVTKCIEPFLKEMDEKIKTTEKIRSILSNVKSV